MPLHFIQMAHIPVPSPVNTPPSASSANRQAEAISTRQSNPNSRIQVTKSASVSMPEMTITRSAAQFSEGPGDGLPGSSGSSDGTSTDKKNGPIDDNTKDFLKVKLLGVSPLKFRLLTVSPGHTRAEIRR